MPCIPPCIPPCIDVEIADARLDAFRSVRDRDLRGTLGLHAVESERVVRRFLVAAVRRGSQPMPPRLEPLALLATTPSIERLADVIVEAIAMFPALVIYRCANEQALHTITGYTMHSGAIALGRRHGDGSISELAACLARGEQPMREVLVALDGVTQTDNVGAIFRNAASFGARGVLLSPRTSDPLLRKALRVSMGRAVNVPFARAREDEWPSCLERLRSERGYRILAAEDTPSAVNLTTIQPAAKTIVIFGAEQDGVSRAVLDLADAVVRIPMSDHATALADDPPSLNVSIASAVILHGLMAD